MLRLAACCWAGSQLLPSGRRQRRTPRKIDLRLWCSSSSAPVRQSSSRLPQDRLKIVHRLGDLSAHVLWIYRTAFVIRRRLARAEDSALCIANLDCLAEAEIILPRPRVNRPPFHNCSFPPPICNCGTLRCSVPEASRKACIYWGCRCLYSPTAPCNVVEPDVRPT